MPEICITALNAYPIKSCGPLPLEASDVTPRGLGLDREWVITRPNGLFLSQRTNPELALIRTALRDEVLLATAPDGTELAIPLYTSESTQREEREIEIFKKAGTGVDEGDAAAEFFSKYLNKQVRLWRNQQPRLIRPERRTAETGFEIGFADGSPLLLTSASSLRALQEVATGPIDMRQFRANIVVDGPGLPPYREDYWRQLRLGRLGAVVAWACTRCPVPNVNQDTGLLPKPAERIVTQALQKTRSGIDPLSGQAEVFFGQNLMVVTDSLARIAVGDPVTVLAETAEPNFLPLAA